MRALAFWCCCRRAALKLITVIVTLLVGLSGAAAGQISSDPVQFAGCNKCSSAKHKDPIITFGSADSVSVRSSVEAAAEPLAMKHCAKHNKQTVFVSVEAPVDTLGDPVAPDGKIFNFACK